MKFFAVPSVFFFLCYFVENSTAAATSKANPNIRENLIQAIANMSAGVLTKYLDGNSEAFVRFGRRIEALSEKLLDQQVDWIDAEMNRVPGEEEESDTTAESEQKKEDAAKEEPAKEEAPKEEPAKDGSAKEEAPKEESAKADALKEDGVVEELAKIDEKIDPFRKNSEQNKEVAPDLQN